ncbi:MAG: amino acid permease [Euryarchaeota archaeon]|nr:amino acid permease [Euryarchaeota archaeon]
MAGEERAGGGQVEVKLKRDLGLLEITMIGLGPTIGSTIFLLVGFGIRIAGPALILAFVFNFLVTILTAMAYAELGSAFSDTGGGYMWVKDGMPQPFGFLAGWMSWFGHSIVTGFYVLGFGYGVVWLLGTITHTPSGSATIPLMGMDVDVLLTVKILAVIACLVFIFINFRGTKSTGRSSNYITGLLIAVVVIYIVAGLVYMLYKPNVAESFQPFIPYGMGQIVVAMGFTFIVFEGYEIIAQCGEECKDAEKNIPRAHWITISLATVVFVLVAIVTIGVVGWQVFAPSASTFSPEEAMKYVASFSMPGWGVWLVSIGIIIGALAAINSTLYSSSRVSFAMGRDGALPKAFGRLHAKRSTPHVAIFISGAIIILMVVFLPLEQIAAAADIMFLILMIFVNIAVITLRLKRPDIRRRYVMPLFPLIPIIGLITKGIMAASLYSYEPNAWLYAILWIELGLVAYYFYTSKEKIAVKEDVPPSMSISDTHGSSKYCVMAAVQGPEDTEVVELAALVSRIEGGDLHLLHVIEVPEAKSLDSVSYGTVNRERKLLSKAKKKAEEIRAKVHTKIVVAHKPAQAIIDEVREARASLLFVGWKGRFGGGRFMGVNIDKILANAESDVILYKSKGIPEDINNILVVSAGEWHDTYAASTAVLLAKRYRAKITVLAVYARDDGIDEARKQLDRLALVCSTHGIKHDKRLEHTHNFERAVLKAAEGAEIVVTGATGSHKSVQEYAFGTLQDKLAQDLDKPLIIVRKARARGIAPSEAPQRPSQ